MSEKYSNNMNSHKPTNGWRTESLLVRLFLNGRNKVEAKAKAKVGNKGSLIFSQIPPCFR
jgi:hypothetical protein